MKTLLRFLNSTGVILDSTNVQPPNFAHPLISPTKMNCFLATGSLMNLIFLLRQGRLIVCMSFILRKKIVILGDLSKIYAVH